MEEEKAAAYYDELSRKGEGAAKFKQGLGFSSSSSSDPFLCNKKTSSFPLLSNFVRASSSNPKISTAEDENNRNSSRTPSSRGNGDEDRARVLDRIHEKLGGGGGGGGGHRRRSPSDDREKRRRERKDSRYDERERDEDMHSSKKSRDRDRVGEYREMRSSRSYSPSRVSRDRERGHRREKDENLKERRSGRGGKGDRVDYSRLIEGYSQMTSAERVKAKMKLQLRQTAAKDTNMGMSSGWERFDFNKDAPLDDDEDETEVAEDDAAIVKDIGRTFRFSAVEARREEEVKAAHDQAMFGGGAATSSRANVAPETTASPEKDGDDTTVDDNGNPTALISDKVLSMQQGSWRDRARRLQNPSG